SYGVVMPDPVDRPGPQPLPRLHRGPDVLFRSRDAERVLRALIAQLATHSTVDEGLVLEAIAVGRGSTVSLVGGPENRVAFARRARRSGLSITDTPNLV